jgi:hypothetical protein
MSGRDRIPELAPSALADVATDERIERVWKRLEGDLGVAETPGLVRSRSRRLPDWMLWAPAAAVILFASGLLVGRAFPPQPGPRVKVERELPAPAEQIAREPAPAAEPRLRDSSERPTEPRPLRHRRPRPVADPPSGEPEPLASEPVAPVEAVAPPEWYRLWDEDEYQRAREAIERQGGFDTALEQASADQAMAMVDLARFSHENALAIEALRRVVDRYPTDPNAPIAALMLGNMLEHAGDTRGAAEAFQAYRALSPEGDFAEDALARQIEAALEQRDPDRARGLVTQYEQEFPNGSRIEELRAELHEAEAQAQRDALVSTPVVDEAASTVAEPPLKVEAP